MARIKRRRATRNRATHIIKTGWSTARGNGKLPSRLNGFLIVRNTSGDNGNYLIAYDLMEELGYTRDMVDQAVADGVKARAGLLPKELKIWLTANAMPGEDGMWTYPRTFESRYQCWAPKLTPQEADEYDPVNMFCHGDGVTATRKLKEGGRIQVPCVPRLVDSDPGEIICPYSESGACKPKGTLTLRVLKPDAEKGFIPLGQPEFNYEFSTTSDESIADIERDLDEAANACNGNIAFITGTIFHNLENTVKKTGEGVKVPRVRLRIDPIKVQSAARAQHQLEAPPPRLQLASEPQESHAPEPELEAEYESQSAPLPTVRQQVIDAMRDCELEVLQNALREYCATRAREEDMDGKAKLALAQKVINYGPDAPKEFKPLITETEDRMEQGRQLVHLQRIFEKLIRENDPFLDCDQFIAQEVEP